MAAISTQGLKAANTNGATTFWPNKATLRLAEKPGYNYSSRVLLRFGGLDGYLAQGSTITEALLNLIFSNTGPEGEAQATAWFVSLPWTGTLDAGQDASTALGWAVRQKNPDPSK